MIEKKLEMREEELNRTRTSDSATSITSLITCCDSCSNMAGMLVFVHHSISSVITYDLFVAQFHNQEASSPIVVD